MGRRERATVTVSIRMPAEIHAAATAVADSVYQSLNAFVVQAVAQRVRHWRDPITGKRVVRQVAPRGLDGWTCYHGSHSAPIAAASCPWGHVAAHRASWANDATELSFDEWAVRVGVPLPVAPDVAPKPPDDGEPPPPPAKGKREREREADT